MTLSSSSLSLRCARAVLLAGWAIGATVIAGASAASAAPKGKDLQDAEYWAEAAKQLQSKQGPLNRACGAEIKASYDEESYNGVGYDEARANAACKQAIDTLTHICGTDLGKEAVKTKVEAFVCRFSTNGTRVTLAGKTLTIHLDPKKTSIEGKQPGSYSWQSAIKERL